LSNRPTPTAGGGYLPAAKGLFTAGAFIAVFAANSPLTAAIIASLVVALTVFGAGIAPSCYLRVATPALFFLALGSLSMAFSLDIGEGPRLSR
jgi:cobalt/nickel transport system permease protein